MKPTKRTICLLSLCFFVLAPRWGHAVEPRLIFKGPKITVLLIDTPLGEVVELLKKERGAWFRGEEALAGKTVSVKFKGLPIRQGIERIFSEVNHCFIFNPEGELEGGYFIQRQSGAKAAAVNSKTKPARSPLIRNKSGVLRPKP